MMGVIGVDHPVAPSARGQAEFVSGVTREIRQLHREALLAARPNEIRDAARTHLAEGKPAALTVLGKDNPFSPDQPAKVAK